MLDSRTNIASILVNDNHPSFSVRRNLGFGRNNISLQFYQQLEQHQPVSNPQYNQPYAASKLPTVPPRDTRNPIDPVIGTMQSYSPGSLQGSAHGYLTNQVTSSAYIPHAQLDPRRDLYEYPCRSTTSKMPLEVPSSAISEPKSSLGSTQVTERKNKYPCPYAASHGCSATLTTSGHAARHGKKHIGEKNNHCPICNKAFIRKDNMKQHIRTHRFHSDNIPSSKLETVTG